MRVGYDSVNPVGCPPDGQVYMGYNDGNYSHSYAGMLARFPGKVHISICTNIDGTADCLDVERYDATPAQVPTWLKRMRALHRTTIVYCSLATVPSVVSAVREAGLVLPLFGVADWDGSPTLPVIPDVNVVWKQYVHDMPYNGSAYDKSSVVNYIPGIDPVPDPPKPPVIEDDMKAFALFETMPASVPTGTAWPGVYAYNQATGEYFHVATQETHNKDTVSNLAGFLKFSEEPVVPITYAQHLILVGE